MAFDPQPLIYSTTSTSGTGPFTCTGAVSGYRAFSNIANGDSVPVIRWDNAGQYEEGLCTVSTTAGVSTLTWTNRTRTSGVANAAITWAPASTQNVKVDGLGSLICHARQYGLEYGGNTALFRTNTQTERAFASGTKWPFVQSAAPTGWTQDTSVNDKALRVVSGAGGGTGGSNTIGGLTVNSHTLTTGEMPNHTHGLWFFRNLGATATVGGSGPIPVIDIYNADPGGAAGNVTVNVATAGGGGGHSHTISHDGTKAYAYQDVIVCAKN